MTLAPGATVGRYTILEPLGQGGMATVYKAFQPSLEREVALKVLRPGFAQDKEFLERFEREAKAIARLRHPHIVQVFDFEMSDGQYVLAMEFLEGGTLKDRQTELAKAHRGMDPAESVRILSEVADALGYAHEQGIVHRDVKPSNVMLTRKDWAVVTDFGIARILGATSHTQTGVGIGTPEYMAPEQGQGGRVDHRADIYSLGAMAYEMLTGQVPYTADTPLAVVIAHIKDPLPLPSKVNPTIGPAVERALLRALAKDPEQRFASATDMAQSLREGLAADAAGGTMPTMVVRAGAAANAVARSTPPAPKQVTLSIRSAIARRSVQLGVAGTLVLATVTGTVLASGALRGSPAASPVPTVASASMPPRGPLIWQAKLDGTDIDMGSGVSAADDPTANEFRVVQGAIEYVVHKATPTGMGRGFRFNSPGREAFVFEVDIDAQAANNIRFNWWEASQQRYGMGIDLKRSQVQLEYSKPGGIIEPLAPAIAADEVRRANPFTAAVVVERDRFAAYVGGRQIAQAVPDGRVPPLSAAVSVIISGNELGAVRLTGVRLYELPSPVAATATSAPAAASAATGASTPTPVPAPPPSPKFAIPAKGALLWEAALDGTNSDIRGLESPCGPDFAPGGIELRSRTGVIEVESTRQSTGLCFTFNSPLRARSVSEFEISFSQNAGIFVGFCIPRQAGCHYLHVNVQPGGDAIAYLTDGASGEAVTGTYDIVGSAQGRTFVLALVVEDAKVAVYVDQRQALQFSDTRSQPRNAQPSVHIGTNSEPGGIVRFAAARVYELP